MPRGDTQKTPLTLSQFGRRIILMKTRARVTKDGGASILVVESEDEEEESINSGDLCMCTNPTTDYYHDR